MSSNTSLPNGRQNRQEEPGPQHHLSLWFQLLSTVIHTWRWVVLTTLGLFVISLAIGFVTGELLAAKITGTVLVGVFTGAGAAAWKALSAMKA